MTLEEYKTKLEALKKQELELTREFIENNPFKELEGKCLEERDLQKKISEIQTENKALKLVKQNIEEDYNNLKLLLRCKYPKIWKEFINMDSFTIEKLKGNEKI